jgi:hypothetical protein
MTFVPLGATSAVVVCNDRLMSIAFDCRAQERSFA